MANNSNTKQKKKEYITAKVLSKDHKKALKKSIQSIQQETCA